MSDPYYRIVLSNKERRLLMSANLYSIESLLIGKAYRSRTLEGIIQDAEKSIDCDTCSGRGHIFYGDNEDYAIEPCECVL